jgi:hypothetical protein
MIPKHLRSLFWDTNVDGFDPAAHPTYTIARVLERGEDEDMAWLLRTFPAVKIQEVLRTDRRLSPRSANFWALVFNVPAPEVAALQL